MSDRAPPFAPETPTRPALPSNVDAPCVWCGRTYEEHALALGPAVPRVPCLGLRSGYRPVEHPSSGAL